MKRLDEMKRLKLLKIEEKGFYLMFYGLVCIIVVQAFLDGFRDIQEVILPIILLMAVFVYLIISCFKEGIWSYQDINRTKFVVIPIVVGIFGTIVFGYKLYLVDSLHVINLLIVFMIVVIVTYLILMIVNWIYTKRMEYLENGDEE